MMRHLSTIYWELKTKDSITYDSMLALGVRKPYDLIRSLRKRGVNIITDRSGNKTRYILEDRNKNIVMGLSNPYDNQKIRHLVVGILSDEKPHKSEELKMRVGVPNIAHIILTLRRQGYKIHCDKTNYRQPKYTLHKD